MIIRPMIPEDHVFVYDSWLGSFSQSALAISMGSLAKSGRLNVYSQRWPSLIRRVLRLTTTVVAADDINPNVILGYAVTEGATLHYIFVRPDFRRAGIATELLKGIPVTHYSSRTTDSQKCLQGSRWSYDPCLLFQHIGSLLVQ